MPAPPASPCTHRRAASPPCSPLAGERPLVSSTSCCRTSQTKTATAGAALSNNSIPTGSRRSKKPSEGKVDRISLIAPTVYGELRYTLTAGDRWKLWKGGKPIAETAKELAQ